MNFLENACVEAGLRPQQVAEQGSPAGQWAAQNGTPRDISHQSSSNNSNSSRGSEGSHDDLRRPSFSIAPPPLPQPTARQPAYGSFDPHQHVNNGFDPQSHAYNTAGAGPPPSYQPPPQTPNGMGTERKAPNGVASVNGAASVTAQSPWPERYLQLARSLYTLDRDNSGVRYSL